MNCEEVLLNVGQVSSYPQIQELAIKKEPYDKLWRTAVDFYAKYDKWMNGPLLNVNAEIVEEEVRKSTYTFAIEKKKHDLNGLSGPVS